MKTSKLLQTLKGVGLTLSITFFTHGCSSSDESTDEEGNNLEENGDNNAANANADANAEANAEGGDSDAAAVEETASPNENLTADTGGNAAAMGGVDETLPAATNAVAAPSNQAFETIPTGGNTAPAAMDAAPAAAPAATGDGSRVVRFITANGTAVRGQADAAASQIASLNQGDAVMVSIMGGWGMIANGRYVQIDNLSEKAVPRAPAANSWN